MSITSIAFNFFSQPPLAPAPTAAAATVTPTASAPAPAPQACGTRGPEHGRRNVLYEAMMAALRELGLTSGPQPAPTGPAPTPGPAPQPTPAPAAAVATPVVTPNPAPSVGAPANPAPAGTPPALSVEEAVYSFAHALWQALRGADSGSRREHRGDDEHHHHGHRRHGHEHGYGMSRGYSGLANRLEALAVRLDASTAGVTPASAPAGTPATQPSAATPAATSAVEAAPAAAPAVATSTPAPAPAPAPAASPLAQAFDAMMRVLRSLNPSAPSTDAAAPSLATFLHSLARGLGAETTTPALSGVGIVINVSV
jgi:hypothetical protein